jgi:alpha-methylacyl-CoA racemase
VTLGALEPKFWAEFCRRVGREDLIARHIPTGVEDRAATMAELAAIFKTKTRDEWVAELGDEDVCLGPVNSVEEALADPQVQSRGVAFPADYDDGDAARALRTTPLISGAPVEMRLGMPKLGEHTEAALTQAGYAAEEIAELVAQGAAALAE